ncbi:MAG: histidine kinase [Ginsengibacter sp.]
MHLQNYFLEVNAIIPVWGWYFFIGAASALFYVFFKVMKLREKRILEIEATKIELEKLRTENYKARLEREQINNFFSASMLMKNNVDEILWDVTKKLIAKLDFEDCLIYMWNQDKTKMVQRAGFGVKNSKEIFTQFPYDLAPGQGIVGTVAQTGKAIIVNDTRKDPRYLAEGYTGLSEISVPIKYEDEVMGVIDSEHSQLGFFNENHLHTMTTIATLMANKIKSIEAEKQLRKQKAELDNISKQLAEMQLAALRSQMNPHFIFNALNSIKKFMLTNEAENADKYLGKFSRLIRSILNTSREANISLEKEIDMLSLYLELEKLRFGKKLNYRIEVDEPLAEGSVFIPTMLVQPFIENAILHGIMHKESDGEIVISFKDFEEYLEINVRDNGVGRKVASQILSDKKDGHSSLGIEVTTKRLQALKTDHQIPAGIEIIDLEENGNAAGTLVKIFVPK